MSNQLLPCPYCGGAPKHSDKFTGARNTWRSNQPVNCANRSMYTAEEWNRRATQPAAGDPVYQVEYLGLDGGGWHDVDRETMELRKAEPKHWRVRTVYTTPHAAAPVAAGEPMALTADDLEGFKLGSAYDEEPGSDCWNNAITKVQCHLREIGTKLVAAPPAAAHGDEAVQWVECSERLPESGQPVLAFYTNRSSKGRRIRANYVAPKTHEVDFADPDTQCVEYDEEGDCFYLQAGWYELIDNWEEYSSIAVIEGEVSHWMPLPAQPAMRAQAGEGESA